MRNTSWAGLLGKSLTWVEHATKSLGVTNNFPRGMHLSRGVTNNCPRGMHLSRGGFSLLFRSAIQLQLFPTLVTWSTLGEWSAYGRAGMAPCGSVSSGSTIPRRPRVEKDLSKPRLVELEYWKTCVGCICVCSQSQITVCLRWDACWNAACNSVGVEIIW